MLRQYFAVGIGTLNNWTLTVAGNCHPQPEFQEFFIG